MDTTSEQPGTPQQGPNFSYHNETPGQYMVEQTEHKALCDHFTSLERTNTSGLHETVLEREFAPAVVEEMSTEALDLSSVGSWAHHTFPISPEPLLIPSPPSVHFPTYPLHTLLSPPSGSSHLPVYYASP